MPKLNAAPEDTTAAEALTIEEFCLRLSKTVSQPEMIGAFCFTERNAGRVKDLESAYQARYRDFATKPA